MIPVIGFFVGAAFGTFRARRAKGNRLDQLQYAAVYGMIFALIGLAISIYLLRAGS